jgi:hypothetical protein
MIGRLTKGAKSLGIAISSESASGVCEQSVDVG